MLGLVDLAVQTLRLLGLKVCFVPNHLGPDELQFEGIYAMNQETPTQPPDTPEAQALRDRYQETLRNSQTRKGINSDHADLSYLRSAEGLAEELSRAPYIVDTATLAIVLEGLAHRARHLDQQGVPGTRATSLMLTRICREVSASVRMQLAKPRDTLAVTLQKYGPHDHELAEYIGGWITRIRVAQGAINQYLDSVREHFRSNDT